MALVTITEAAKLVRRGRASIYRDMDRGVVSTTVLPSGEKRIETSELVRAYGQLHPTETSTASTETSSAKEIADFADKVDTWTASTGVSKQRHETPGDSSEAARAAILEEKLRSAQHRIELLERIVSLEKTVRTDTVDALRAQLADKDVLVKALENQVLVLGYNKPDAVNVPADVLGEQSRRGWWGRLFRRT